MKMKAYVANSDDESVVVFGLRNSMALRREAACRMWHGDVESIESVRRAPEFDEFADAGAVPIKAMIDNGWLYGCAGCDLMVDSHPCDRDDVPLDGPAYSDEHPHQVWCSINCRDADIAQRAEQDT